MIDVLALPDVRARLQRDAIETQAMSAEEFTTFLTQEIDKWAPLARRVGQAN